MVPTIVVNEVDDKRAPAVQEKVSTHPIRATDFQIFLFSRVYPGRVQYVLIGTNGVTLKRKKKRRENSFNYDTVCNYLRV